jgi:predicted nucleic acid-binding protein
VAKIVLSDATPLIYLAQITDGLSILERIYGQLTITSMVEDELLPGERAPGEHEIKQAIQAGIIKVIKDEWPQPVFPWLDEGEESTIRAAVNLANAGHRCLVLMDEKDGRAALRQLMSATVTLTGTAASVGRARELGLIPSASAVFRELQEKGFYISTDIVRAVLRNIGEAVEALPPTKGKGGGLNPTKTRRRR